MNTNDWIKYVTEKIDNISCCPVQRDIYFLTFEPDDNLKQVIKEHNCTYRVIPKEYIPVGEESNCFIMPMPKLNYKKELVMDDSLQSL